MSPLRNLLAGLRALFHKKQVEREMDEELNHYLDAAVKDKMRSGMSREKALRATRLEMGSLDAVKEEIRSVGWESTFETLWQDIRYGLRQLRRSPGFTAVAVLTLALGIGANTAIFSLIDAVMLRMLPVEKSEELFQVEYGGPDWGGGESSTFSNPVWKHVRDLQDVFSGAFAWSNKDKFDLSQGGVEHVADGIWVSGSFFSTLGLCPSAGRLIADSDDRRGCPAVVVLSYGFWQDRYGGAKNAIGSTLSLRSRTVEVIGVAPRGFFGMEVGERFDVALPICAAAIFDGKQGCTTGK